MRIETRYKLVALCHDGILRAISNGRDRDAAEWTRLLVFYARLENADREDAS